LLVTFVDAYRETLEDGVFQSYRFYSVLSFRVM
jgi:hypothetical protein